MKHYENETENKPEKKQDDGHFVLVFLTTAVVGGFSIFLGLTYIMRNWYTESFCILVLIGVMVLVPPFVIYKVANSLEPF